MATDEHLHGDAPTPRPAAERPEQEPAPSAAESTTHEPEAANAKLGELEAELAREREAAADYLRRWQQAQADLANVKRHAQQQQEQQVRLATGRALALVLPAIDSFERAFATLPSTLRSFSWISGLALVEMQLQSVLAASGAAEVPAEPGAAFNPQHHEAVGEVETAEHPAGHIAAVLQRGYAVEGQLIRPALVQLARAPQSPAGADTSEDTASSTGAPEAAAPADGDMEGDDDREA